MFGLFDGGGLSAEDAARLRRVERKLDAIFAFGSQFEGRTAFGDVFGGDRPIREQILAYHAYYGSLIRKAYGEPYWTKDTVRVEDLAALDVSSF